MSQPRVFVCTGTACASLDAEAAKTRFEQTAGKQIEVRGSCCLGLCAQGPLVRVELADESEAIYEHVTADLAAEIGKTLVDGGRPAVPELDLEAPFFTRQVRIVTANAGRIDPESIEDYLAVGGYDALSKAVTSMSPQEVVAEVSRSGLRGRGGAGFPTGVKWGLVARAVGDQKYVICNGDEGDPGAYMDRSIMEGDPHRVLEGMAIAAYAVGANQGYLYVRGEYPLAIRRLQRAIRQAEREGVLGARIFDTPFQFRVDIRIGGGAFVCGEETALIASIEGGRGQPHARPPYPAASGLWGKPTLINNVETYANIASVVLHGGAWYAEYGTEKSRGTKVFALAGTITEHRAGRSALRNHRPRNHRGHRRRNHRWPPVQGHSDRRTVWRLRARIDARPQHRLRFTRECRYDCWIRRTAGHGRHVMYGRLRALLHGLLHARVVRQVHSVSDRHRRGRAHSGPHHDRSGHA